MRRVCLSLVLALPLVAHAGALRVDAAAREPAEVRICYNYGCGNEGVVRLHAATLARLGEGLAGARTEAEERERLAEVVGWLYRLASTQTPVGADRAGNFLDAGAHGRMDCIDHATSTTRLLKLVEARGWLRFHRVLEPARRTRLVVLQHFSAVVEVRAACDCTDEGRVIEAADGGGRPGERYAVDSWFVGNGEPAVVLPLAEWLNGGGPNVQ